MTKPRGIVTGPGGAVTIEYLRMSRVLRFVTPADRSAEAVEMPLAEFVAGLGLEAADLVSTRHYLLFGGAGGVEGGLRDLIGAFHVEATAKDAFRSIRLSPAFKGGWAELVVLQPEGRMKPLCWFGRAPSGAPGGGAPTRELTVSSGLGRRLLGGVRLGGPAPSGGRLLGRRPSRLLDRR